MKNILTILSFFLFSFIWAQEVSPPSTSQPSVNKKIHIDELIKITEFENYFNDYCKRKIEEIAKKKNWDDEKKQKVVNSINFNFYKNSIYNAFSFDSEENLKSIVELFKKINKDRNYSMSKLFPFDALMQYNLEGYIETVIDEK
jgi:hypothetical protein